MLSICIPTYNQCVFVGRAIESCLAQEGVEVLVIVSDDASTDATSIELNRFAGDPRVVYYRHDKNMGISWNAGWVMAQAKTDYLVRLDSDDILAPNYCATLMGALNLNPTAGVAHANAREIDQHDKVRRTRMLARSPGLQSSEDAIILGIKGYRVAANICMFRRVALPQGPIYRLGMNFCEDWDLFLRIADEGWGNIYIARELCSYRVWLDGNGIRSKRRRVEIQGITRVFNETLEPAWRRRGLSLAPLSSARSNFACEQARSLAGSLYSSAEKDYIILDLYLLSPNDVVLKLMIFFMRSVFASLILFFYRFKIVAKDFVKKLLHGLRISSLT